MRGRASELHGACGIWNWIYFDGWSNPKGSPGAGLHIANFINSYACREAYKDMSKKYKLLYQSPVRQNNNSGNHGFFCVFGDKDRY